MIKTAHLLHLRVESAEINHGKPGNPDLHMLQRVVFGKLGYTPEAQQH